MVIVKKIGIMTLSLVLLFGTASCTNEPLSKNSSSPEASVKAAKPGYIESVKESLPLEKEVVFTADNFLVTSTNDTRFTVKAYGQLDENPNGLPAAEGEVFHAIHYSQVSPAVYNIEEPEVTFAVDGVANTDEIWLRPTGTLILSAPENAEITINITTYDVSQSMNFKTAERLSNGIVEAWYSPYEGEITNPLINKPAGTGNASIAMNLIWAVRTPYEEILEWADDGKQTWVIVEAENMGWETGANTIIDETNNAWLTDDKGTIYKLANSRETEDITRMIFMVPTDVKNLNFHTSHSGKIMNGDEMVENIPEFTINESMITFQ